MISIAWVFLGKQFYNNFTPFIFFVFGFPVFGYLYFSNLSRFSDLLKKSEPELFKKYALNYGYFKDDLIRQMDLYNNPDFDNLTDEELNQFIRTIKNAFKYMVLSFFSFAIVAIMTIYIK
jgi:hypothetical protein